MIDINYPNGRRNYLARHGALIEAGNHVHLRLAPEEIRPLDVIVYDTGGCSGDVSRVRQWVGGTWEVFTTTATITIEPWRAVTIARPGEVTFARTRDGRHTYMSGRRWRDAAVGLEADRGAWVLVGDVDLPTWARNLRPGEWTVGPNEYAAAAVA